MNIATIILVFVIAWWMLFMGSLSIGVKSQHEVDEEAIKGTDPGAPTNPMLKKKIIGVSIAAVVFTIIYYFVATSGLISIR